jgi:hypothetical protein
MGYEMTQQTNIPTDPELKGADAALRRAAITAKKLAEQQGVPYVTKDSMSRVSDVLPTPQNSPRGQ